MQFAEDIIKEATAFVEKDPVSQEEPEQTTTPKDAKEDDYPP